MDQTERGIWQHPHFDLLVRESFVERAIARQRAGRRILGFTGTPTPTERRLCGNCRNEILRIKVRVADDAHRPRHFRKGFASHLEQAGAEVTRDAVVGNGTFQALF